MSRRPARRAAIGAVLIALGLTLLVALAGVWSFAGPGPEAPQGEATVVVLERGSGLSKIANSLEAAGVISSASLFAIAARLTGAAGELKAGEYEVPSRAPMARVLADIRAGRVVRRSITIPEGWTSGMVVDALNAHEALTGTVTEPPEGAVLPDTYDYQRGEERSAVLARMMAAQETLVAELWSKRQPDLPIATPEQAVILASIVEKETGVPAERPRVAAVFVNRLRQGMPLQSDPTIIYGLTKGRPLGRGIRASELAGETAYNTYRIPALPPTPIANPGRDALAAVMNPPATRDLYFVADGTGGHVFAETYAEHEKNVARWRAIERERAAAGGGR